MIKNFVSEKDEFGFLGLGQCGGNICEVAEKYGYFTGVVNTSKDDLNSLELVRSKLLIENGGGCGKNRSEGIEAVKKNYTRIINFVQKTFANQTTIYVAFSTGGGTGSGFSPIVIDILRKTFSKKENKKNFIAMTFTPNNKEGLSSLDNTVECLRELYNLKIPTMIIDNQKFFERNKNKSKKEFFDLINVYAVSNLANIFKPENGYASTSGNADKKDLSKMFELPGCIMIAKRKFTEKDLVNKGIEQIILNAIDSNIYANINKDQVIGRMGFIYEMPNRCMPNTTYDKIVEEFGTPIDIFEGFRDIGEDKKEFRIIVIFSGLSFPKERIEEYAKLVEEKESNTNESEDDIFSGINKDRKYLNNKRKSMIEVNDNIEGFSEDEEELDLGALFSQYD